MDHHSISISQGLAKTGRLKVSPGEIATSCCLKGGRIGIGEPDEVGTDKQLSEGGGHELEASCGRETDTFVTAH